MQTEFRKISVSESKAFSQNHPDLPEVAFGFQNAISEVQMCIRDRYYTMRELKATKINAADFAPFGTFFSMTEPEGYPLHGEIHKFYPDRISGTCMGSIGFSPIAVHKDERIVKAAEYHTTTWEGIVALDDDMIIHVAPASAGAPVPDVYKRQPLPRQTVILSFIYTFPAKFNFLLMLFLFQRSQF